MIGFTNEHILSEVLSEATAQAVQAASHVGAGGPCRYAERFGDFRFAEPAEVAQGHCLPLPARQ